MEQIIFSLNVVLPVFLTGAFGYFLRQKNIMSEEFVAQASALCFSAFLPVMLFLEIYEQDTTKGLDPFIFGYNFFGTIGVIVVTLWVTPLIVKDKSRIGSICQAVFRSNIMAIGYPILRNMYGEDGGSYFAPMMAPIIVVYNISAILSFTLFAPNSGGEKLTFKSIAKKISRNRYIIAMTLAYICVWLGIRLPTAILRAADNISALSIPLALVTIGGQFSFAAAKNNLRYSIPTCLVRVLAVPLVMVTGAVLLGMRGEALVTTLVVYGSSTAVSCAPMARSMQGDYELAGEITLLSALFSVFSLFVFILIFRIFGLI